MKLKLTKTAILELAPPAHGRLTVHDTATPGLAVQVTANGSRTFYCVRWYNGRVKWVRIGDAGEWTVENARIRAREINSDLSAGVDPNIIKRERREEATLEDLWTVYRREVKKGVRTMAEDEGLWNRYLSTLAPRVLSEISEEVVQRLYNRIAGGKMDGKAKDSRGRERPIKGGPTAANRALALVSGMFSACARQLGKGGYNPARGIRREKETACDRYLAAEELPAFWSALATQHETTRDLIKLAIFTAQRRMTLLTMRWDEINFNFKAWTIPGAKMKSGKAHAVPLVPEALEILDRRRQADPEGEWVLASPGSATGYIREPKKALKAIAKAAGIEAVTLHDLRRTIATWMNSTGASESTIAHLLAHKYRNVTGIYAKASADAVRAALAKASAAIVEATGQAIAARPAAKRKRKAPAAA